MTVGPSSHVGYPFVCFIQSGHEEFVITRILRIPLEQNFFSNTKSSLYQTDTGVL